MDILCSSGPILVTQHWEIKPLIHRLFSAGGFADGGEVELFWRLSQVASLGTENRHGSTQVLKQATVFCMALMSTLTAGPADSYALREGGRGETIWRAPKAPPRVVAQNSWYSSPNKRPQERKRLASTAQDRKPLNHQHVSDGLWVRNPRNPPHTS